MVKLNAFVLLLVAMSALMAFGASHVAGAGNGALSVSPPTQNVLSGIADYGGVPGKGHPGIFSVAVHQNADVTTIGAQTNVTFDATKLKVNSVVKGSAYSTAQTLIAGVAPQTLQDAINEANTTGVLQNVAVAFSDATAGTVAPGDAEALVITMETLPLAAGTSPITLSNSELIDSTGDIVALGAPTNGQVNISIDSDRDGDGCPDLNEQQVAGGSQQSGGLRDFENPYDYFNPSGDGLNRVDDILDVVAQYFMDDNDGSQGLPPYVAGYTPSTDRTDDPGSGEQWDLLRGNGLQRVDDILHSVNQYFHDC